MERGARAHTQLFSQANNAWQTVGWSASDVAGQAAVGRGNLCPSRHSQGKTPRLLADRQHLQHAQLSSSFRDALALALPAAAGTGSLAAGPAPTLQEVLALGYL